MAAASDLEPVLPALAAAYFQKTGVHLLPNFASSATLTQEIQNGAPVDVFLSADCSHPQQLAAAHLAAEPGPRQYATGILVLWARRDSPAQPLSLGSLRSPKVTHIAVANAQHAPYGAAALAELAGLRMLQALRPKLVTGENIMQTAQFALTGNADAAFISLTIVSSAKFREVGSFVPLPRDYPPLRQCGIVLQRSADPVAAGAFLDWLLSPDVQNRLPRYGLDPAR